MKYITDVRKLHILNKKVAINKKSEVFERVSCLFSQLNQALSPSFKVSDAVRQDNQDVH